MKKALIGFGVVGIVVACCILLLVLRLGCGAANQAARVVERTIDADNVIYNYEWFKKQWRAVNAIDKKVVVQEASAAQFKSEAGARTDWTFEDKGEYARLNAVATGLKQQRADMVADYNAKASMVNRSIFMGKDCPEHID